jgi:outer membrane protein assembly factor BamB
MQKPLKLTALCFSGFVFISQVGVALTPSFEPPSLFEDASILFHRFTRSFGSWENYQEASSLAMAEDTLLVGSYQTGICALYPHFNKNRWMISSEIKGGVTSPLTLQDGIAYFGAGDGYLYAVQIDQGKINWKTDLRNGNFSAPAWDSQRLFVRLGDESLVSLDAVTGKVIWTYAHPSTAPTKVHNLPKPVVYEGQHVLVGFSDGRLLSVSVDFGQVTKELKLNESGRFKDIAATAVIEGNRAYVAAYDGHLYAIDLDNWGILWEAPYGGTQQIVLLGKQLFFPSSDGYVLCLDKNSGQKEWAKPFELEGGTPTELLLVKNWIIFGSSYRYFYVLMRDSGEAVFRKDIGLSSGFRAPPVLDSKFQEVFALSLGGNLMGFSLGSSEYRQLKTFSSL